MSAVAERAGVERRTLYRHFPNEADLFEACSTHYFAGQPVARPRRMARDSRSASSGSRGLDELYAYYERTEPMLSNVLRDAETVDFARDAVAPLDAFLDEAAETLAGVLESAGAGAAPPRRPAPRRRVLDLAVTRGERHQATRCGEAHEPTRRGRWRRSRVMSS